MTVSSTTVRMGALARMDWAPTHASAQRLGQAGIALKTWMNVRFRVPLAAKTGVPARTWLAAFTVYV